MIINPFGLIIIVLFLVFNNKILKKILDKTLGKKRNEKISKINDEYINAMMEYMKEKDKKEKLKKAEKALILQSKITPVAFKMLIIGCYYFAVFTIFNAIFKNEQILCGLNWVWTMIFCAITIFLLKKSNKFEFEDILGA